MAYLLEAEKSPWMCIALRGIPENKKRKKQHLAYLLAGEVSMDIRRLVSPV
jgi:hypothetical protein